VTPAEFVPLAQIVPFRQHPSPQHVLVFWQQWSPQQRCSLPQHVGPQQVEDLSQQVPAGQHFCDFGQHLPSQQDSSLVQQVLPHFRDVDGHGPQVPAPPFLPDWHRDPDGQHVPEQQC
jgi:hypothetical protein